MFHAGVLSDYEDDNGCITGIFSVLPVSLIIEAGWITRGTYRCLRCGSRDQRATPGNEQRSFLEGTGDGWEGETA